MSRSRLVLSLVLLLAVALTAISALAENPSPSPAPMELTLPSSLDVNDPLTLQMTVPQEASRFSAHIYSTDPAGSVDTWKYFSLAECVQNGSSYSYTFSSGASAGPYEIELVLDPGSFQIDVEVLDSSWSTLTRASRSFTVTGTRPAGPVVSGPSSGLVGTSVELTLASCQGATKVQFTNGYGESICYSLAERGSGFVYHAYLGMEGNTDYAFRAKINGQWTSLSAPHRIACSYAGSLDKPMLVAPGQLQAGTAMTLSFDNAYPSGTFVYAEISGGNYHYNVSGLASEGLSLPFGLDGDTYTIRARASCHTYRESETAEYTLSVTGSRPAAPSVTLDQTSAGYGDSIWATVSAPGMDAAAFEGPVYEKQPVYLAQDGKARICKVIDSYQPQGTGTLRYRARIGGVWSEAAEATINYKGDEYSSLPAPDLDAQSYQITLGSDLVFSVTQPPLAGSVTAGLVRLSDTDPDETVLCILYDYILDPDASGACRLPASFFMEPGLYRLNVHCYPSASIGWQNYGDDAYATVTVLPATSPVSPPQAVLTSAPVLNCPAEFDVTAPGADRLSCIILGPEREYGVYMNPLLIDADPSGTTHFVTERLYHPGVHDIYFAAEKDGVWSAYCAPVSFNLDAAASSVSQFTVSGFPETIVLGEPFTLSFADDQDVEYYQLGLYLNGGVTVLEDPHMLKTPSRTFVLTKADMAACTSWYAYFNITAYAAGKNPCFLEDGPGDILVLDPDLKPSITWSASPDVLGAGNLHLSGYQDATMLQLSIDGAEPVYFALSGQTQDLTLNLGWGSHEITYMVFSGTLTELIHPSTPETLRVSATFPAASTLQLPSDLTAIGDDAFRSTREAYVYVPESVRSIGAGAFASSASLRAVYIPAAVTDIDPTAFDGCGLLTVITPAGSAAADLALQKGWTVVNP